MRSSLAQPQPVTAAQPCEQRSGPREPGAETLPRAFPTCPASIIISCPDVLRGVRKSDLLTVRLGWGEERKGLGRGCLWGNMEGEGGRHPAVTAKSDGGGRIRENTCSVLSVHSDTTSPVCLFTTVLPIQQYSSLCFSLKVNVASDYITVAISCSYQNGFCDLTLIQSYMYSTSVLVQMFGCIIW